MSDQSEAERLIRCFDPAASFAAGAHENLILSPRWARIRRQHPQATETEVEELPP